MKRQKKFEILLDEGITRILHGNSNVDEVISKHPGYKDLLQTDFEIVLWLRDQGVRIRPRPGYIANSKHYLESRLNEQKNAGWKWRIVSRLPNISLSRLVAVILIVLFIFLGGGGIAAAANNALPGDTLYPLRTASEGLQLALTINPTKDAQLHLQFAQEHLVSCALLTSQGRSVEALIALKNYERHITGTGRIVQQLSQNQDDNAAVLSIDLNQIYLQDIEVFRVLLPGEY